MQVPVYEQSRKPDSACKPGGQILDPRDGRIRYRTVDADGELAGKVEEVGFADQRCGSKSSISKPVWRRMLFSVPGAMGLWFGTVTRRCPWLIECVSRFGGFEKSQGG